MSSTAPWADVKRVLGEALDRPAALRASFLDEACAGRPRLRVRVDALIRSHDRADDRRLNPESGLATQALFRDAGPLSPGDLVGRYRVQRLLGAGGMGAVYEACDTSLGRTVALKVLATMQTKSAVHRFEHEAKTLASLSHPGVAHIHETGIHSPLPGVSIPYFVMEYVEDASSITTFAQGQRLGLRERMAIFAEACDAVAHGHSKGVIHRDLKPSNILVDRQGRVKVIDLGVARVVGNQLHDSVRTRAGEIVGTPRYMSPEQARGDDCAVDVRSDVYALGVVLYELLCGCPPYAIEHSSIAAAVRVILSEAAVRPSSLDRRLRGDPEAILDKALEKEPASRYQSAAELAADLRRALHGEPIAARPHSNIYHIRAFARRNRVLVAATVAGVAALAIGLASTSIALLYARRAERVAQNEAARAQRTTTFLANAIRATNPNASSFDPERLGTADSALVEAWVGDRSAWGNISWGEGGVGDLLRIIGERAQADLNGDPLVQAEIASLLGEALQNRSEGDSRPWRKRAWEIRRAQLGPDHPETIRSGVSMGLYIRTEANAQEAQALQEIYASAQRVMGPFDPRTLLAASVVAPSTHDPAGWMFALAERARAELGPHDLRTLEARRRWVDVLLEGATSPAEFQQAEAASRELREGLRSLHADSTLALFAWSALAEAIERQTHREQDATTEWRGLLQEAVRIRGKEDPWSNSVRVRLFSALLRQRRLGEAETIAREALKFSLRAYPHSYDAVKARGRLARVLLWETGHAEEAIVLARQAAEENNKFEPGPFGHFTLYHRALWAEALRQSRDPAAAEGLIRGDLALIERETVALPGWVTAMQHLALGLALRDQGHNSESELEFDKAEASAAGLHDPSHPLILTVHDCRGQ